jgi:hypothetical protein
MGTTAYYRVRAVNTAGTSDYSAVRPGATAASAPLPTYGAAQSQFVFTQQGRVSDAVAADFNCDNRPDVLLNDGVVGSTTLLPVKVALADGSGGFIDGTSGVFVGSPPSVQHERKILVDDFNGDGRPDVFIAGHGIDGAPYTGQQNRLILSTTHCKLIDATANLPQQMDFTHSATTGDVDNDGDVDIYVGNIWGANLIPPQIWRNDGTGHFTVAPGFLPAAQTNLDLNRYTTSLFVDVNNDGRLDLVLGADEFSPQVGVQSQSVVLINDGTGHFSVLPGAIPAKPFGPDAIALDVKSNDFNHDGFADLAMEFTKWNPYYQGRWIQLLRNNGNGTFTDETATRLFPAQTDNLLTWLLQVHFVDFNGDGTDDLIGQLIGINTDEHRFYTANGQGVFTEQSWLAGRLGDVFALVDARGDGHRDVLSTSNIGNDQHRVSLLSDTGPVATPGIPQRVRPTVALGDRVRAWWPYVWGATSYEVWRSTSAGTVGTLLGAVSASSFDDATAVPATTYYYRVRAVNSAGASDYSPPVQGLRASAPVIQTHPGNQTVVVGATATFTAAATGVPAPTIQWQVSTNTGVTWTDLTAVAPYSGVTSPTLTVVVGNGLNGARYRAVASTGAGSVVTNAATLTVIPVLGPQLVQNGSFGAGTSSWLLFATRDPSYLQSAVNGGVLEFTRVAPPAGTSIRRPCSRRRASPWRLAPRCARSSTSATVVRCASASAY